MDEMQEVACLADRPAQRAGAGARRVARAAAECRPRYPRRAGAVVEHHGARWVPMHKRGCNSRMKSGWPPIWRGWRARGTPACSVGRRLSVAVGTDSRGAGGVVCGRRRERAVDPQVAIVGSARGQRSRPGPRRICPRPGRCRLCDHQRPGRRHRRRGASAPPDAGGKTSPCSAPEPT